MSPSALRRVALLYLTIALGVPLGVILQDGLSEGVRGLVDALSSPVALHALKLTLWTSGLACLLNLVMGGLTAYVLVRYRFPGRALLNAIIDLPLAIPTLVTGVMLVVLYGPQSVLGRMTQERLGFDIVFAPPGIVLALLFITFPFVVRAVQPVMEDLEIQQEEAAHTLGADNWTVFRRVILPPLMLPLLSGALLSFARAVGEFGSIVVVAGNLPLRTQTASVFVLGEVESENRLAASAMSIVLVTLSYSLVLLVNRLRERSSLVQDQ